MNYVNPLVDNYKALERHKYFKRFHFGTLDDGEGVTYLRDLKRRDPKKCVYYLGWEPDSMRTGYIAYIIGTNPHRYGQIP